SHRYAGGLELLKEGDEHRRLRVQDVGRSTRGVKGCVLNAFRQKRPFHRTPRLPVSPGYRVLNTQKLAATCRAHIINETVSRGGNWSAFVDNELSGFSLDPPRTRLSSGPGEQFDLTWHLAVR